MDVISQYQYLIEITGAVLGFIYIFFSIKKSLWLWPLGLLTSFFYIFVYLFSKLYAEMALQVYYVAVSIYGWLHWVFAKNLDNKAELPVSKLNRKNFLIYTAAFFIIELIIYLILRNYTDSPIPFWDSLVTTLSIIGTWMLAKKVLENWIIWIIADAMCIVVYIYKDLYPTAILFFVYTVMAVVGYRNWKKSL